MIRKLTEADREPLMALICKEPALNLFIIGDIENFGFEQEFMDIWGEFDFAGAPIKAVLLRFYRNYLPYAEGPFDVKGFSEIMRKDKNTHMVSGKPQVVQAFSEYLHFREEKQMLFAELKEIERGISGGLSAGIEESEQEIDDSSSAGIEEKALKTTAALSAPKLIRNATVDHVEAICSLTDTIDEFQFSREGSRINLRKTLESGTGRTYFMELEGQVIATASTSAENSMSAMVVAVATHQAYRGQGLASRVVAELCADLLSEGKTSCLFYDNPQAGTIYKRLGFHDIGSWSMVFL